MWRNIILFLLLFCYVFAFYIFNISVSFLIALPLLGLAFFDRKYCYVLWQVVICKYVKNIIVAWTIVMFFALFFSIFYGTWDFSFLRVIAVQLFHLISALPVLAYLKYKSYTFKDVEEVFVWIFIAQTFVQCTVLMSSELSEMIYYFNKFDPELVKGPGSYIRGKALSAATTYHLSLIYGVAFILYVKRFLTEKVSLKIVLMGILIFIGIFFAGRTGFVGVLFGVLGYFFSNKVNLGKKIRLMIYSLLGCGFFVVVLYIFFPNFYMVLENYVLPYAFEFLYSLDSSGKMETASTNQLMGMWQRDFNYMEFLLGSGKYTLENGGYYMTVDPGILRHTLFMGVIGYLFLVAYQFVLFPIHRLQGQTRFYYTLIMLYWIVMEFKGCTLGSNKFVFSTSVLLIFSYFYLNPEVKRGNYV